MTCVLGCYEHKGLTFELLIAMIFTISYVWGIAYSRVDTYYNCTLNFAFATRHVCKNEYSHAC